jgi:molybdopterin-binding protein
LLDEPLSALDPATRGSVAAELASVLREAAVPALVVTHSYEEAVSLADRVAVIERGRIVQEGAGRELLEAPATPFVAEFAGTNLLAGVASGRHVALDRGGAVHLADPAQGAVAVLVAPWQITVSHAVADDSALNHIAGRVERVVPLGNRVRVVVAGITAEITPESAARLELRPGGEAVVSWKATSARIVSRRAPACSPTAGRAFQGVDRELGGHRCLLSQRPHPGAARRRGWRLHWRARSNSRPVLCSTLGRDAPPDRPGQAQGHLLGRRGCRGAGTWLALAPAG